MSWPPLTLSALARLSHTKISMKCAAKYPVGCGKKRVDLRFWIDIWERDAAQSSATSS